MTARQRIAQVFAIALAVALCAAIAVPFATRPMGAAPSTYYVSPGGNDANDGLSPTTPFQTIQKAVDLAQPGTAINLAPGVYLQDVRSARDGQPDARIALKGPADAVVMGGGAARIVEINHDNITLEGFTIDGLWGDPNSAGAYRDKLLYVLGKQPRDGVSGLKVLGMTFRNAGGECVRLRYFAQHNEIAGSNISTCGVHDFRFAAGGKNGEGIYIGTASEQRADGKNPTADPDESSANWIHDNVFNTQGNECVDIKESASANVVENNRCTGQKDPESGGFDSRGSGNIFRNNETFGNAGAGIRLGGDTATEGIANDVYGNSVHDNKSGGIKVQRQPQGQVCGNTMTGNAGGDAVGSYPSSIQPTAACHGAPTPTNPPAPTPTAPTNPPAPTATSMPPQPQSCAPAYAVDGGTHVFVEAERYSDKAGSFKQLADSHRSGGAYMAIPGDGMRKDAGTYLSFNLKVSAGGRFYVWMLGYGSSDSADSFYVQADGGKLVRSNLTVKKWGWKRADGSISLGDGAHVLKIQNREDGSRVDKVLLTKDSSFVPAGLGGAALEAQCL